jgi:hypothetical protein
MFADYHPSLLEPILALLVPFLLAFICFGVSWILARTVVPFPPLERPWEHAELEKLKAPRLFRVSGAIFLAASPIALSVEEAIFYVRALHRDKDMLLFLGLIPLDLFLFLIGAMFLINLTKIFVRIAKTPSN